MSAPINNLLRDPTTCRVVTDDVSVHWYPSWDAATCYCGKNTRADRQEPDA